MIHFSYSSVEKASVVLLLVLLVVLLCWLFFIKWKCTTSTSSTNQIPRLESQRLNKNWCQRTRLPVLKTVPRINCSAIPITNSSKRKTRRIFSCITAQKLQVKRRNLGQESKIWQDLHEEAIAKTIAKERIGSKQRQYQIDCYTKIITSKMNRSPARK